MLKRTLILLSLASAIGAAFPTTAFASKTIAGRITAYSPTSLSVHGKEVVTLAVDDRTTYTKLITQKPWGEDTRLDARALRTGRYVAVHVRKDNGAVADWVQIATDMRPVVSTAIAADLRTAAVVTPFEGQLAASGDTLSATEALDLVANAKTPADHRKLGKHFGAVAARYDADANEHVAVADAYRRAPNASETKRPGSPDTAAHCDRLAQSARDAATAARALAADHERMASAAK